MERAVAVVAVVVILACLSPGVAKAAGAPNPQSCGADREYSVIALQRARGYVKNQRRFPSTVARMQCGLDVLSGLPKARELPGCRPCADEYAGLMKDVAHLAAQAASASDGEVAKSRRAREIEVRVRLGDFLESAGDDALLARHWDDNFANLMDALEKSKDGESYNLRMLETDPARMSAESFKGWIRAIRTCGSWDFRREGLAYGAIKASICQEPCRRAADRLRENLEESTLTDTERGSVERAMSAYLPTTDHCPVAR